MPSSRRQGPTQKINGFDWLISLPLFCVASTALEIASEPQLAGVAFFIRCFFTILFAALALLKYGLRTTSSQTNLILTICSYFVFVNLSNFTSFAIMGVAFIGLGMLVSTNFSRLEPSIFDFYLRWYLWLNIAGLAVALVVYIATGEIWDLHKLAFPFSESRSGIHLGQVRLSGFQIEPGNYANYLYCFVLMRAVLNRRLFDLINTLAIFSTLLTLAAWSVVGFVTFSLSIAVEFALNKSISLNLRLVALSTSVLIALVLIGSAFDIFSNDEVMLYFNKRLGFGEDSGSTQLKVMAWEAWLGALDTRMLFGRSLPETFCSLCPSPQDLGTVLNMMYYFGILPTSLLFGAAMFSIARVSLAIFLFAFPLIIAKLYFFDPVVWFLFGLMLFMPKEAVSVMARRKERANEEVKGGMVSNEVRREGGKVAT